MLFFNFVAAALEFKYFELKCCVVALCVAFILLSCPVLIRGQRSMKGGALSTDSEPHFSFLIINS